MIVKLWPIRGTKGVKACVDYVRDDTKVTSFTVNDDGTISRNVYQKQASYDEVKDLQDVIAYVSNPEKTMDGERTYVSGYQCHPDHILEQFAANRQALGVYETGEQEILCYHMVQSFPKGLSISDEEAHQCGIELLQKMGAYQGIVCTHVNPIADDEGHLHGEQVHNHIVFSAYKLPEFIDPEHPNQLKFNRCNATYEQLQVWNDEIALDHGLPIISELNINNLYSWELGNQNTTNEWRDRMRYDIRQERHKAKDWEDFKARMTKLGYTLKEGSHLTYIAPDGLHRARGEALGSDYTKNGLLAFWMLRLQQQKAVSQAARSGTVSPLRQVYNNAGPELYIQIPIADSDSIYRMPLNRDNLSRDAIDSYFQEGRLYEVTDYEGNKVYMATGAEAKALLLELQREREQDRDQEAEIQRRVRNMERDRQQAEREAKADDKERRGTYSKFFWNEDGTRKNTAEMSFVVASLLLGQYFGLENQYTQEARKIADQRHARDLRRQAGPDRRLQMMMDGLAVVKQEGFRTEEDINKAVNAAGWSYNKAKKALDNTHARIKKLEPLLKAFEDYEDTAELVSMINNMDDGPEKETMKEQHRDLFEKYNQARQVMYGFKTPPEKIDETRARVQSMKQSIPRLEEQFDKAKAELRRMKRTQYAFQLSRSSEYLAGREADTGKDQERTHTKQKDRQRDAGR